MDNKAEISKYKTINKNILRLGSSKAKKKKEIIMIYFWPLTSKKVS